MTNDKAGDVSRLVQIASEHLHEKLTLPKNSAKTHWNTSSDQALLDALDKEITEIRNEVRYTSQFRELTQGEIHRIMFEACDVMAFAAMLHDNHDARTAVPREPPQTPETHSGCDAKPGAEAPDFLLRDPKGKGTSETSVEPYSGSSEPVASKEAAHSASGTTLLPPRRVLFDQGVFC